MPRPFAIDHLLVPIDDFIFRTIQPRMGPQIARLLTDRRVMRHDYTDPTPISTLREVFKSEYWLIPHLVKELYPVSEDERIYMTQGFALLYLAAMVLDNLVDQQTPSDEPLVSLLAHDLQRQAQIHFQARFADMPEFWDLFQHYWGNLLHALTLEYACLEQWQPHYSLEHMYAVDDGKAACQHITMHGLALLSGREAITERVNAIHSAVVYSDQFGDDAQDWLADWQAGRATLPLVQVAKEEKLPLEQVMSSETSEEWLEDALHRHHILIGMCDKAVEVLQEAKQTLSELDGDETGLMQLLDIRIAQEQFRGRQFKSIAFFRGFRRKLLSDT